MRALIRQLRPALLMVAVFTVLTGVAYPLVVTAVSQVVFNHEANGSLVEREGPDGRSTVVGSELIGQDFTASGYLHPRPSATYEWEYNGAASSGSNLGPRSPDLLAAVEAEATAYREENGLAPDALVPVDAVTASGSGLDPHISVANARIQAARVAEARGLDIEVVNDVIDSHTAGRAYGILGEPAVNVLLVNLALDEIAALQ
jgi:potassium-transporting ATPase KdpC subunit